MSPYPTPPPTISPKSRSQSEKVTHFFDPADEQQSPDTYITAETKTYFTPTRSQDQPRAQTGGSFTEQSQTTYVTATQEVSERVSESIHIDGSQQTFVTASQENTYVPPPLGEANSYFHPSKTPTPDPNATATAALAAAYINPTAPLMPDKPYVRPAEGEAAAYFNPSHAPTPVNGAPITSTPPPFIGKPPMPAPSPRAHGRMSPVVHPMPTPYNASRPKPRRGFVRRMWKKFTKWLRSVLNWVVKHPVRATVLALLPIFVIGGMVKLVKSLSKGFKSAFRDILMGLGWNFTRSDDDSKVKSRNEKDVRVRREEVTFKDYSVNDSRRVKDVKVETEKDVFVERERHYADDVNVKGDYGYLSRLGFFGDYFDSKTANIPKGGYHVDVYGTKLDDVSKATLYQDEYDVQEARNTRGGYYGGSYSLGSGGFGLEPGYQVEEVKVKKDYKVVERTRGMCPVHMLLGKVDDFTKVMR